MNQLHSSLHAYVALLASFVLLTVCSNPSFANSFGTYDARTLSLGGTAVALGNARDGHLYNPALTAFHDGSEDRTQDGSHSYHAVLSNVSDGARTLAKAYRDDLESELSWAIDRFNQIPTPNRARIGIEAAASLEHAMRRLEHQSIQAEGYIGYSISVPGDREGGAFFIGSRAIIRGRPRIAPEDFDVLNDYQEALLFIETHGQEGQEHPELLNEQGLFKNPNERIKSSVTGYGTVFSEIGVSAAKEFQWQQWKVALGIAPKLVHLLALDEQWKVAGNQFVTDSETDSDLYFNVDLGTAVTLADTWRIGLSVKDLRERVFRTDWGSIITSRPRTRIGVAYFNEHFNVGVDMDVDSVKDGHKRNPRQEVSVGMELNITPQFALRTGYRHDVEKSFDDQFSIGFGWRLGRLSTDLAIGLGDSGDGAALHLGWSH